MAFRKDNDHAIISKGKPKDAGKPHKKTSQTSKWSWRFAGNADYDAEQVSLVRSHKRIVRLLSQRVADIVGDEVCMP